MAIFKKSTQQKSETKVIPDEKDGTLPYVEKPQDDSVSDFETGESESEKEPGQLAVDVFQTADEIVVVAPVAGVRPSDLSINITDEVLTIKGARNFQFKAAGSDYFTQECFWGNFSRSIILPESVDAGNVSASFKNGILTVRIPKVEKIRTRMVKIKEE
ncbi:Hsp20/alpha crystallin family protein [Candidatus Peregrinibacteria bacterium]|nr:Hsp20/alpha crystallin family protein [Candidatus Peregrinibacteria bacterium]